MPYRNKFKTSLSQSKPLTRRGVGADTHCQVVDCKRAHAYKKVVRGRNVFIRRVHK
jgi:hypothetical protein